MIRCFLDDCGWNNSDGNAIVIVVVSAIIAIVMIIVLVTIIYIITIIFDFNIYISVKSIHVGKCRKSENVFVAYKYPFYKHAFQCFMHITR